MKKTAIKKIQLHRETLRQLDPEQLIGLAGADTVTVCRGSCMASCICGGSVNCNKSNCSTAC